MNQIIPLPEEVAAIFAAAAKLESRFPGRKFTPDGHLVGSIGEVIAAKALGLQLYPSSHPGHDAHDPASGQDVQIKLTGGRSIALYDTCDRLLVLASWTPHKPKLSTKATGIAPGRPRVREARTGNASSVCTACG